MCTVSWLDSGDGFHLFSNRDEKHTRAMAIPPALHERDGVRFVAPLDAQAGGTWVSVNEYGIAVCLLNGSGGRAGMRSRGVLVLDAATARTQDDALQAIMNRDLGGFPPFTVVVLEPGRDAALAEWNGTETGVILRGEPYRPLASSSFDAAGVRRARTAQFAQSKPSTVEELLRFHASHLPERGPYSPCMHRDDARTVSFTWVEVNPEGVTMRYRPGPPCEARPFEEVQLCGCFC